MQKFIKIAIIILAGAGIFAGGWFLAEKLLGRPIIAPDQPNGVVLSPEEAANLQARQQWVKTATQWETKDSDLDNIPDTEEAKLGTDPKKEDTDDDGLNDDQEIYVFKTDPKKYDTDGDGVTDGTEVARGANPLGAGKLER
ncbi:MAG: hypothetical protein WCT40_02720 [Candidatus Magasanikbacteria bacterium]|jgi:hypothetical protein